MSAVLPYTHTKTERDKLRDRAHDLITRAMRKGQLPRPSTGICVDCGAAGYCYDHRDYRKPFDVQIVCVVEIHSEAHANAAASLDRYNLSVFIGVSTGRSDPWLQRAAYFKKRDPWYA